MRFASLCFGVGVIGSPILLLPSQGPPIPIWAVFLKDLICLLRNKVVQFRTSF